MSSRWLAADLMVVVMKSWLCCGRRHPGWLRWVSFSSLHTRSARVGATPLSTNRLIVSEELLRQNNTRCGPWAFDLLSPFSSLVVSEQPQHSLPASLLILASRTKGRKSDDVRTWITKLVFPPNKKMKTKKHIPAVDRNLKERPTKVIACVGLGLCLARHHRCPEGSTAAIRRRGKVSASPNTRPLLRWTNRSCVGVLGVARLKVRASKCLTMCDGVHRDLSFESPREN